MKQELAVANRRRRICLLAAAAVAGFYLAAANPEFRFMEGASAIKLLHARALLAGQGYTDIGRIGAPPEIVRPPGFPLLLAGLFKVFGENLLALKLVNNLFAPLGFLALLYLFRSRIESFRLCLLLATAGFLFPHLLSLARYLEAELLFCLLWFWALAVLERAQAQGFRDRRKLALLCLLISTACLVRSAAMVLVPAAVLALWFARSAGAKQRLVWAAAIAGSWLLVGGGWMVRTQVKAPAGEMTYLNKLMSAEPVGSIYWLFEDQRTPMLPPPRPGGIKDWAGRVPLNFLFLLRQGLENIWPGLAAKSSAQILALTGAPLLLMALGLGQGLFKKRGAIEFAALLYLIMILLWPYQDHRFLLPAAPLLIFFMVEGMRSLGRLVSRDQSPDAWVVRAPAPFVLLVLIVIFIAFDLRLLLQDKTRPRDFQVESALGFRINAPHAGAYHSLLLLEWIRENSLAGDRVLYHSYPPCGLITRRECTSPPATRPQWVVGREGGAVLAPATPEQLMRFIDQNGITLVVVDDEHRYVPLPMNSLTPALLTPAVRSHPARFKLEKEIEGSEARVLRVLPP